MNMAASDEKFNILSIEEAFSFLSNVLCISEPEKKLKGNRLSLLAEIQRAMFYHIPYQTLRSLSTPHEERHLPTPVEIKEDVFNKIGGRCYTLNIFGMMLLRALGYDLTLVPSTVMTHEDTHAVLIVNDLIYPGSKHLVDFGSASPTFHPIPLDFEEISPEYTDSHLRYRFVRQGETIVRQHRAETDPRHVSLLKEFTTDGWMSFFFIHIDRSVNAAHFASTVSKLYTDADSGFPFLITMYCSAYPNGRLVYIKNTTLLLEDGEGRVQKSYLRSRGDLVAAYARYFPQFPEMMVRAAIDDENIKLDYTRHLQGNGASA